MAANCSKPRLEHSLLYTATLCLLAFGAVMVYSASSAESLLAGTGDPSYYLKRYVAFAAVGLVVLHVLSRHGLRLVRPLIPALLGLSFVLTVAVMVPGVGVEVNGATRWLAAGPIQFQPSELLKVAMVLYAAQLLARRPWTVESLRDLLLPLGLVVGAACALLLAQPDLGTAIVICLAIGMLLVAAGARMRHLATIAGTGAGLTLVMILIEPYRRERLITFLDPWSNASDSGFQVVQSMIAIGSGGVFGVGLGESVQKVFYLPEAHTDMILAIVGEELGVLGILAVAALYGIIAYAGFRAAKLARDRLAKLLAAGLTALILSQATLNLFAVMGMAPLTGVPLPFMSYGNSNLIVLLGAMGILLNVASGARVEAARAGSEGRLRVVEGERSGQGRDRGRRDRRSRGAGARGRGRAAG
ncbi:MAG: putative lipid II flippase FtsW [Thermoleophilaceae bacterium]|jgi:cell division protein FtsW